MSAFEYKSSIEKYLYLKNVENRIAIAKIRIGSCKIAILTGKWSKISFEKGFSRFVTSKK